MELRFWGVRGSVPVPGKATATFGGNTTCIEVVTDAGMRFIFDAGTGIRLLGQELCKQRVPYERIHVFFTHFHWDHIQGFPFFDPIYSSNLAHSSPSGAPSTMSLYSPRGFEKKLQQHLCGQMSDNYFPVKLEQVASKISFKTITEENFYIGSTKITYGKLNHPGGAFGYRVEDSGKSVVVATDYEHPDNLSADESLIALASGCDILVYDGQYTPQEYEPSLYGIPGVGTKGFGHSTPQEGAKFAQDNGVKKLIITHHNPLHDDNKLTEMEKETQKIFKDSLFAREGTCIKL